MMKQKNRTAIGFTLGCRLNQADTALIFGRLEGAGFSIIKPQKGCKPDLIVINTCTVTANAARKSRQTARHFKRKYPDACLIVTGCDCDKALADWEKEEYVDFALINSQKKNIPEIAASWQKDKQAHISIGIDKQKKLVFQENAFADFPFKNRAFLKIQEGCDSFCTYCIVPYVRGRERSRAFDEVIAEAKEFIRRGHKEIVITGVNISTYFDKDKRIVDILDTITKLPGEFRIRLSSMEPHSENRSLVKLIKNNHKICRFLHIPLQHGSDTVLAKMGRNYTSANFAEFANFAIDSIPGLHMGTDVIVGFPGETDELFLESVNFIKKIAFANIHVFRFSPRKGTPAATFPNQVPQQIAKQRAEILGKIAKESKKQFFQLQIGKNLPVLLEKETASHTFEGWSDNYVRVVLFGNKLDTGKIVNQKITANNFLSF